MTLSTALLPIVYPYLRNKYTRWYYIIINDARNRSKIDGYVEKHHIIPKCIGGTNEKDNIVKLTAREHFVCHWLLTKMTIGTVYYKMENALACFQRRSQQQDRIYTGIQYSRARLAASISMKGRISPNKGRKMKNPPWNKGKKIGPYPNAKPQNGRKDSEATKIKKSLAHKGRIRPKGKHWWTNGTENKPAYECPGQDWYLGRLLKHQNYRPSPLKGKQTARKGIPTGRSPANKGKPSPHKGLSGKNAGKTHWNNGIDSKIAFECPGDGWNPGRLTKGTKYGPMTAQRRQNISNAKKSKGLGHIDQ